MVSLLFATLLLVSGTLGEEFCRQYSINTADFRVYYCRGKCCGSLYEDDCCDVSTNSDTDVHSIRGTNKLDDDNSRARMYIVGAAVIVCQLVLFILVSIILCVVKFCQTPCTKGAVVDHKKVLITRTWNINPRFLDAIKYPREEDRFFPVNPDCHRLGCH